MINIFSFILFMMQLFLPILLFAILKSFPQDDMVGSSSVSEPDELSSLVMVKKEEVVEDYEERHGLEGVNWLMLGFEKVLLF